MRFKHFINEANINIDMSSYNALIKQIKTFSKAGFLKKINAYFNPKGVYFFVTDDDTKFGVGRASLAMLRDASATVIKVFINPHKIFELIEEDEFHLFALDLSSTIEHELIHKEQSNRVHPSNKVMVFSKGQSKDGMEGYLSNEHELMAYANTIVRELEHNGFDKEEILDMIRKPMNNITPYTPQEWSEDLERYIEVFKNHPKVLKRLYKYMYQYIVGEEDV